MNPYPGREALNTASISDRSRYFRATVLGWLEQGNDPARLSEVLIDAVECEQYELANGIDAARADFARNPQLGLFGLSVG